MIVSVLFELPRGRASTAIVQEVILFADIQLSKAEIVVKISEA